MTGNLVALFVFLYTIDTWATSNREEYRRDKMPRNMGRFILVLSMQEHIQDRIMRLRVITKSQVPLGPTCRKHERIVASLYMFFSFTHIVLRILVI